MFGLFTRVVQTIKSPPPPSPSCREIIYAGFFNCIRCENGTVELYCVKDGDHIHFGSLVGHTQRVDQIERLLTNALFTTSELDGTIKLWDKSDLHCMLTIPLPPKFITIKDDLETKVIIVVCQDAVTVWNVPEKRVMCMFESPNMHMDTYFCPYVLNNSGDLLYKVDAEKLLVEVREVEQSGCIIATVQVPPAVDDVLQVSLLHDSSESVDFFLRRESDEETIISRPLPKKHTYSYDYSSSRLTKRLFEQVEIEPTETDRVVFDLLTTYLPPELAVMAVR